MIDEWHEFRARKHYKIIITIYNQLDSILRSRIAHWSLLRMFPTLPSLSNAFDSNATSYRAWSLFPWLNLFALMLKTGMIECKLRSWPSEGEYALLWTLAQLISNWIAMRVAIFWLYFTFVYIPFKLTQAITVYASIHIHAAFGTTKLRNSWYIRIRERGG